MGSLIDAATTGASDAADLSEGSAAAGSSQVGSAAAGAASFSPSSASGGGAQKILKNLSSNLQSTANHDMSDFNTIFQVNTQHQMPQQQKSSGLGPMPTINAPPSPVSIVTSDKTAKTKIIPALQTQSFLNALTRIYNGR